MAEGSDRDRFGLRLNGFGDFLDEKAIHFVGRRPVRNECVSCGVVYCCVKISKCMHSFCLACSERITRLNALCPVDGRRVVFGKAVCHLDESHLAFYTVRCLNSPHGCQFEGSLTDLEEHVLKRCPYSPVTCRRCGEPMPQSQLADHRAACREKRVTAASGFSKNACRKVDKSKGGSDIMAGSSTSASDLAEGAVQSTLPKEVATEKDSDSSSESFLEPMPFGDGVIKDNHRCALVRQLLSVEDVDCYFVHSEAATISPGSIGGAGASMTDGNRPATSSAKSTGEGNNKQNGKPPDPRKILRQIHTDASTVTPEVLKEALQYAILRSSPKARAAAAAAFEGMLAGIEREIKVIKVRNSSALKAAMMESVKHKGNQESLAHDNPQSERTALAAPSASSFAHVQSTSTPAPSASKDSSDTSGRSTAAPEKTLDDLSTDEEDTAL